VKTESAIKSIKQLTPIYNTARGMLIEGDAINVIKNGNKEGYAPFIDQALREKLVDIESLVKLICDKLIGEQVKEGGIDELEKFEGWIDEINKAGEDLKTLLPKKGEIHILTAIQNNIDKKLDTIKNGGIIRGFFGDNNALKGVAKLINPSISNEKIATVLKRLLNSEKADAQKDIRSAIKMVLLYGEKSQQKAYLLTVTALAKHKGEPPPEMRESLAPPVKRPRSRLVTLLIEGS
jgi:hypothetical protein